MVLIRLLWAVMSAFFKPKIESMQEPFVLHFRVWPTELGGTVLNSARYFTFMEACQFEFAVRAGLVRDMFKNGGHATMRSVHAWYKKSLKCFQKFTVKTQMIYWDDKWLYFEHFFESKGMLVAHGIIKVGWLRKRNVSAPQEVAESAGYVLKKVEKPKMLTVFEEAG